MLQAHRLQPQAERGLSGAHFLLLGLVGHMYLLVLFVESSVGALIASHTVTDLRGVWVLGNTLPTLEFLSWAILKKMGLCHPQLSHNVRNEKIPSIRKQGRKRFRRLLP